MPDIRTMYDRAFVFAYDLAGKDVTVTIERIEAGTLTGTGGKTARKPVLYFRGSTKGLALCITNARVIAGLYGGFDSDKWLGKAITLFPTTTSFGPNIVECIRIRPTIPTKKSTALRDDVPPPSPTPDQEPPDHESTGAI